MSTPLEHLPGWSDLSDHDRAELRRFRQFLGIQSSRRAGGDPGVCDALEAALYPEGIGRGPAGGAPEA